MSDVEPGAVAKRPGRARSSTKHEAILASALELLASEGYTRMTLDQVAASAHVSKSSIHLRWKTKADLVTAAIVGIRMTEASPPSGDLRTDLVSVLKDFGENLDRTNGMALLGTCLAEEAHTPSLISLLRERAIVPRRDLVREILEKAQLSGDIAARSSLDDAVSMMLGSFFAEYLAGRQRRDDWAERVVDLALAALTPRAP